MAKTSYETDVVAWAQEQAKLLRARRFEALDIEHLADEIEDVGKSEQRVLESRMAVLLAHLLKWQYQPERRGDSWRRTIVEQRRRLLRRLDQTPSLKPNFKDPGWWAGVWVDALDIAIRDTVLWYEAFPDTCPWTPDKILDPDWLPA
ncbi:DUF29 domain-containing protein [Candidatus Methylocalor cossyra]|uniref:DUF29 domain-containing protein n=1 Tax=Candidatus Methylocalor cossyra TaxID=3108543 RepID=A0ABP1CCH5_9GAMM